MSLDITFSLDDNDLDYFRGIMQLAQGKMTAAERDSAVDAAQALLDGIDCDQLPRFVALKLQDTQALVDMVTDRDWPLEEHEKQDIISALAYFSFAQDLIDDDIPVLGYIDDAILIELVHREVAPEIEAYKQFCEYRNYAALQPGEHPENISVDDWLKDKREQLFSRMRARRKRSRSTDNEGRITSFSLAS